MAVYSAVSAGEKDPESPIDVSLIEKLDQNPEAMIEGASGAPRVQTAALEQTASSEAVTTATIRDLNITTAKLAASAVESDKVNKVIGSTGSQSVSGGGGTWTIPVGLYNLAADVLTLQLQMQVSSVWYGAHDPSGFIWSDGTNMRIRNTDAAAQTIYWQKMS